jgi:hypothetical protein
MMLMFVLLEVGDWSELLQTVGVLTVLELLWRYMMAGTEVKGSP